MFNCVCVCMCDYKVLPFFRLVIIKKYLTLVEGKYGIMFVDMASFWEVLVCVL